MRLALNGPGGLGWPDLCVLGGLLGLAACSPSGEVVPALLGLSGETPDGAVRGLIRPLGAGCGGGVEQVSVGLWAPGFATAGEVTGELSREAGANWIWFPLETGVGEGIAALALDAQGARLPLGGRTGEFTVQLTRTDAPTAQELALLDAQGRASVEAEQRAWEAGSFLLTESPSPEEAGAAARTVGELQLRGDLPPWINLFDETWMTPGQVPAQRADQGSDLLLGFPIEPSLQGEHGAIRINVPLRQVVVPSAADPVEGDRSLRLVPGALSPEQRGARVSEAMAQADAAETRWAIEMGAKLAKTAWRGDAGCLQPAQVDQSWVLVFAGYDVNVLAEDGVCVVEIEPTRLQHRRRFRGRVGPEGLMADEDP